MQASVGSGGGLPQEIVWINFLLLNVSFPGFLSFRQNIGRISTWKVFFLKIVIFIMKNVTNFRKTVETGVDLCLTT